ncbi:uncharacterized protein LOC143373736 isoform X3 [Andrena cerasifolii]|uniref:uncharacterized protein LOC143373736 isoform X3 n=1 Tax=Andrena cerasifolii TaxID=2819439 RepID=UPI004037B04F
MKLYRLSSLIFILYCTGWYSCGVSCAKSKNAKALTSIKHETPDLQSHHEDSEQTKRSQRELKRSDFSIDTKDGPTQERDTRRVLYSRKHLKPHDANQVANYFLSGGPLKGHTHFTRSLNCDAGENEANVVGMSNPSTDNNAESTTNDENFSTNSSDSIVGAAHIPGFYSLPHIPLRSSLLHSVLHPVLHPHINRLHSLPSTLLRAASLPVHGLLQAQSELHKVLEPPLYHTPLYHTPLYPTPSYPTPLQHAPLYHTPLQHAPLYHTPLHLPLRSPLYRSLVRSTNPLIRRSKIRGNSLSGLTHLTGLHSPLLGAASPSSFDSKNMIHPNVLAHSEPLGYIVKYVPHGTEAAPLSPVVGSTHQASNCINNDLNTEQDAVGAVNENEDARENQNDGAVDESNVNDN